MYFHNLHVVCVGFCTYIVYIIYSYTKFINLAHIYIYIYTCIYKYTLYMDIHLDKPLTFCC